MAPKKKSIPKTLKDLVWDENIGAEKGVGQCYVCEQEINSKKFHCGHVISEKDGGETNKDNLKPICATCNLSMKTKNMEEFKKEYFSQNKLKQIKEIKKECFFSKFHEYVNKKYIFENDMNDIRYKTLADYLKANKITYLSVFGNKKYNSNDDCTKLLDSLKLNGKNCYSYLECIDYINQAQKNNEYVCDECCYVKNNL